MPQPRIDSCSSQVLLFTGDRRMPRRQYFFFLCLQAFVCDIAPHANLQIIESQGNNSRRLFCPLTTPVVAADAVILLKFTLAVTQMRQREKTPSGKHPQGSSPWTSGQSGSCGRFWPKQLLLLSKFKVCSSIGLNSMSWVLCEQVMIELLRTTLLFCDLFVWQSIAKCWKQEVQISLNLTWKLLWNLINPNVFLMYLWQTFFIIQSKLSNLALPRVYHFSPLLSHVCLQKSAGLPTVVSSNLKAPTSVREGVGKKERVCTVPPLQFGEIYEWTKPKSVRVYTQREFGRRDLRSTVWVIIQSSRSHISHFESHRLWERTDLSYTQVAHVQAPKSKEKQKQHTLVDQMFFHFKVMRSLLTAELTI